MSFRNYNFQGPGYLRKSIEIGSSGIPFQPPDFPRLSPLLKCPSLPKVGTSVKAEAAHSSACRVEQLCNSLCWHSALPNLKERVSCTGKTAEIFQRHFSSQTQDLLYSWICAFSDSSLVFPALSLAIQGTVAFPCLLTRSFTLF